MAPAARSRRTKLPASSFANLIRGGKKRLARLFFADVEKTPSTGPLSVKSDETSARLRAAMDELPEGIVLLDPDGRYIHWNRAYAEIYQRSADLFEVGVRMVDTLRVGVARGDYPDALGREEAWIEERMKILANPGKRHEQRLANGRWILIDERRLADGCSIGMRVDVTEMKNREASFRLLFESNPIPMFVFEKTSHAIMAVNDAAAAHYGYDRGRLLRMSFDHLVDESYRSDIDAVADGNRRIALAVHVCADHTQIDVTTYSQDFTFEGCAATLVAVVDTTERNKTEARIAFLARHDVLTGLANRAYFKEQLNEQLAHAARGACSLAILLVDLDSFKKVNDTLGHSVGDLLLQEAAKRLVEASSAGDLVARLGGDEFVILHRAADDPNEIPDLATRVLEALSQPFEIEGQTMLIGASVGISVATNEIRCPETLMRQADLALYASKGKGRRMFSFFEPELDIVSRARAKLEAELRLALANDELEVHYQPIVDLRTGRLKCMEALVRWMHPSRGLVMPGEFIQFAEEIGLIGAIGEVALNRACRDAVNWPDDVKVAVNFSPMQFRCANILALVMQALQRSSLPATRLDVEITETLLMENSEATLATLDALRRLGVGIALDDFGTGYSSLYYLQSFPFSKIKIDRRFVHAIDTRTTSQAIVRAVVAMGASLGIEVIAEGIERREDLDYLIDAGCHHGQGFYFAPGRPAHECLGLNSVENEETAA
ncbi:putative bifunctional diguanylate cyclase/phosphodiesterase [Methylocystis parvus]|uniref:EAL domain-containing protein n=1 Tax=Methylocystis parvus TaxID=134 RepID=A0A6B8MC71_9HYPH|nr:EAL domain-containing protein [Methylocystis parvus]QGN00189.1 EAL domain-containing protein [Methylocystis parvus]WBK02501.1 EAL domain-containing protein [Methylocystis parvus OBBP]